MASARHTQKRHGRHQKHTPHFLKVYTPYLPLLVIVSTAAAIATSSPQRGLQAVSQINNSHAGQQVAATRINAVTGQNLNFIVIIVAGLAFGGLLVILIKHLSAVRQWINNSQHYAFNHATFDLTIISLIGLLYIASQKIS